MAINYVIPTGLTEPMLETSYQEGSTLAKLLGPMWDGWESVGSAVLVFVLAR